MLRARFSYVLMLAFGVSAQGIGLAATPMAGAQMWRDSFQADRVNFSDIGRNPYFVLEPGYRLTFTSGKDTLIVTVLEDTKVVDGVRARVVEEKETSGGKLAEVSRNYFVVDRGTGDLYYFGEDVDEYKNGKITGHEGSWLAGVNGAKFGLMIPGKPAVKDRYYQEIAPKVAMDRAEIISVTEEIKVPAGVFKNCLHTRESSAVEGGTEDKWYAPGIGLIKDAEFVLAKVEKTKP
jgi:hypothetical protein